MDAAQTVRMANQIASILKAKFRDHVSIEIVDERGTSQNTDAKRREARAGFLIVKSTAGNLDQQQSASNSVDPTNNSTSLRARDDDLSSSIVDTA
jgi:hypothetical protein